MKREPLPEHLRNRPFLTDEATESGVSRGRLRSNDLDRSVWGVRRTVSDVDTITLRCQTLATRLPAHTFFSHSTAALLLGAPLPPAIERQAKLHVAVAAPHARLHSRSLIGHRLKVAGGDVATRAGLRHTSALRTWIDLATILQLDDLVAVGDYFIHHRHPVMSVGTLRGRLEKMAGQRGVKLCREAVDLLNDRPESRPESLLRLIVLRSGLPEPRINHVLVDTETGKDVRPDFIFDKQKLILEYQGAYHRTLKQWRKDMTRRTRLETAGWRVLELNADDLKDPTELVTRIKLALSLTR